jgi:hypothetical protein
MCGGSGSPAVEDGSRRLWEKVAAGITCAGGRASSVESLTKGRDDHPLQILDLSDNEIREAGAKAAAAIVCLGETCGAAAAPCCFYYFYNELFSNPPPHFPILRHKHHAHQRQRQCPRRCRRRCSCGSHGRQLQPPRAGNESCRQGSRVIYPRNNNRDTNPNTPTAFSKIHPLLPLIRRR